MRITPGVAVQQDDHIRKCANTNKNTMECNAREHENIGEHDRTGTGQTDVINSWDPLDPNKHVRIHRVCLYICVM